MPLARRAPDRGYRRHQVQRQSAGRPADQGECAGAVHRFLVALLILSPEGLGALRAVLNNQVQRAMNLFFGSVLATISLTVPAVTIIATLTGQTLIFGLQTPHIVVMLTVLLLCQLSFSTGRTNVLNGTAHLALFAAYMMTIFA